MVVTGAGVVCSLGSTAGELWEGLVTGRSGVAPVTRFDPGRFRSRLAAEVEDAEVVLEPGPHVFEFKRMSAFVRYALFAADQAVQDSGLNLGAPGDGAFHRPDSRRREGFSWAWPWADCPASRPVCSGRNTKGCAGRARS